MIRDFLRPSPASAKVILILLFQPTNYRNSCSNKVKYLIYKPMNHQTCFLVLWSFLYNEQQNVIHNCRMLRNHSVKCLNYKYYNINEGNIRASDKAKLHLVPYNTIY